MSNGYSTFGMVIEAPSGEVLVPEIELQPPSRNFNSVLDSSKKVDKFTALLPVPIVHPTISAHVPPRQLDLDDHHVDIPLQKDFIENTFSEMVNEAPSERLVPLVVLDCANIGWCYGVDSFSAEGVRIALRYFQHLQLDVQGFLPSSYLRAKPAHNDFSSHVRGNAMMVTEDMELLQELAGTSLLTIVPSGDSDDAYILNYARDNNGFVISNDLFNDHLRNISNPSIRSSMYVWLQDHRCGYAFSAKKEFLFNPSSQLREAVQLHLEQQWNLREEQAQNASTVDMLTLTSEGDGESVGATSPSHIKLNSNENTIGDASSSNNGERSATNNTQITTVIESISVIIRQITDMNCVTKRSASDTNNNNGEACLNNANFDAELKHLLLTRASLLSKAGLVDAAEQDLLTIITHIDSQCTEALELLDMLRI